MVTDIKKKIDQLRKEIDRVDDQILVNLNRRAKIVKQIGNLKTRQKADYYVPSREHEIFERVLKDSKGPFPNDSLRSVFREIMSGCLALQSPLTVAFLGPLGTFSHMAGIKKFGLSVQFLPVPRFADVFDEVLKGKADYGIVPVENSTEGTVSETLDLFVDTSLRISGEVTLEISHYLMSRSGNLKDIKKIYSHPQPIAQCRKWLDKNLPHALLFEVESTAEGANRAKEDPSFAAIASKYAADLYGLQIIKERIEDNPNNYTRFFVISRESMKPTGKDKTSLLFSCKDEVGALYKSIKPFSDNNINMNRIESRPVKTRAWEYLFFVDIEGHCEDKNVCLAIGELKKNCQFLKILGSYPLAE